MNETPSAFDLEPRPAHLHPRAVPWQHALAWYEDAMRLFKRAPATWIGLAILTVMTELALKSVPGVIIGEGPWGLPIKLPLAMRTRQTIVFGRTGSGKSTLAGHVVDDDLDSGRSMVVIGAEKSTFRDDLLPRIPRDRASEVVYWTADSDCPVSLAFFQPEEGESAADCAAELYHAFRLATEESSIGGRSDAIARNTFQALTTFRGSTFDTIRPFLTDRTFRAKVLASNRDPRCLDFWKTFERFPNNAELPFLARIDQITGSSARSILCRPKSSFSLTRTLDHGLLFVELAALDPDSFRLVVQLLLSRIQLALMRRDKIPEEKRPFLSIVLDEFHLLVNSSSAAVYTLRQLASRSRRMNAALLLLTQHPGQLSPAVRDEVLGNCSTLISFAVGAKDAHAIAREFTVLDTETGKLRSLAPEALVALPIGSGYARIGTGALALRVKFKAPLAHRPVEDGERVKAISWQTFGRESDAPGILTDAATPSVAGDQSRTSADKDVELTVAEVRFLKAVVQNPGQPSADYARTLGLNGTKAAKIRTTLVERRLVREHTVARKAKGKPALLLEPLDAALKTLTCTEGEHP
jgi:hypothetical protein